MSNLFWVFLIVCVGCGTLSRIVALKIKSRDTRDYGTDDTRVIQEMHHGLLRMEERIESLETIIVDRAGQSSAFHQVD